MTHTLVFDIETVPDVAGLRALRGAAGPIAGFSPADHTTRPMSLHRAPLYLALSLAFAASTAAAESFATVKLFK